jgi:hypothetical protein
VLQEICFLDTEINAFISFDVKPFGKESSDVVLANTKRAVNEALSRV